MVLLVGFEVGEHFIRRYAIELEPNRAEERSGR
jgi:hypothetical protein